MFFAKTKQKSRAVPIVIGGLLGVVVVLFATKMWLGPRKLIDIDQEIVEQNIAIWEKNQPNSYNIQIEVKGNLNGVYDVHVKDGQVVKAYFGDRELKGTRTLQTWSVPGMIRMLELDLANQQRLQKKGIKLMVRAQFDSEYGYPARYQRLDYSNRQAASWTVVKFD